MAQYTNVTIKDIARGIDLRSAPNNIPEGYSQTLQNVDTNSNGFLSKRAGFEGYYGYLPIRVESVVHEGTEIKFNLGGGANTTALGSTPIMVFGKLSGAQAGDFSTTDKFVYYTGFTTDIPDDLIAGVGTIAVPESRHGVNSDDVFIGVLLADGLLGNTTWEIMDKVAIADTAPHDVDIDFTIASDKEAYIFLTEKTEAGAAYARTDSVSAGTTSTITINTATHSLNNFNILTRSYALIGTDWEEIEPDVATVDVITGAVNITYENSSTSAVTFKSVLSSAPVENSDTDFVAAGSTGIITIDAPDENFYFLDVYELSGSTRTKVLPNAVSRNATTGVITVELANSSASPVFYECFWEFAVLSSSSIIVEDTTATSTSYTDAVPQLTIWGIPHKGLYSTDVASEGHVTYIDSYRREAEARMLAGIGGNIFAARTRQAVGDTYGIPFSTVSWSDRTSSSVNIGPLFETTGSTVLRTRGSVYADNIIANKALVSSCELITAGQVKYFLDLENKVGDISTGVSITAATADKLTITGMGNKTNNGTFDIISVDNAENSITVSNPLAKLPLINEDGVTGRAGVFTDHIAVSSSPEYITGDKLRPTIFGLVVPTIVRMAGSTLVVDAVTGYFNLPTGLLLTASRITDVVPMTSTENFVKGDMCEVINSIVTDSDISTRTVSGEQRLARKVRVLGVNSNDINIVSLTPDPAGIRVVISSDLPLQIGSKLLLNQTTSAEVDGVHTVLDITSPTEFVVDGELSAAISSLGVVKGNTLLIDEPLEINDSPATVTEFRVEGRWIPVEAPLTDDDLPSKTHVRYFANKSYTEQDIIRSTMVSDNMYFTNYSDEVFKFDGSSIYKAGLGPWSPSLFSQVSTAAGASIPISAIAASVTNAANNRFTVGAGTAEQFSAGERIVHTDDNAKYTVLSVSPANNYIFVDKAVTGGNTGSIRRTVEYRYYFKLNAIDANQNIISSSATNPNECIVELTAAGQIRHKLIGLPDWGALDYDAIEIQVYRTKANTIGPFFRVRAVDINFNNSDGYILVRDGSIDEVLVEFDSVSLAIGGSELGLSWDIPLRSKYITSTNNRLILGNVKGYPKLKLSLARRPGEASIAMSDIAGKIVTLRRDLNDTGTITNMVDRAKFEFVNSDAVTITPDTDIAAGSDDFTVTSTEHGLVAGNWVYMFHAAKGQLKELDHAGWWQIASATADTFTINSIGAIAGTTNDVNRFVSADDPRDIPVWIGLDGNFNQQTYDRLDEFTVMLTLSKAINTTTRMTDRSIAGFEDYKPYVLAEAGSTVGFGQMSLRQINAINVIFALTTPDAPATGFWFINDVLVATTKTTAARTPIFNSRVLISYPNYPEIFDNPAGEISDSESAVDINSADGQEITGIIPFFGDSVFSGGTSEDFVVVFKTNSVYLLNTNTREISRLQTRGQGCTAPYSIAQTKEGIMFANESGIYRLNKDLSVSYVGSALERAWEDSLNKQEISRATGHHYSVGRKYKLSVPIGNGQRTNNEVFVYDHQREGGDQRLGVSQEFGAWTTYTNHNATGWANLLNDAFFSTTDGQVFKIRNANDYTDYRDDNQAVAQMVIELRPEDFGVSGVRKLVSNVVSSFQMRRSGMTGTRMEVIADNDGIPIDAGLFNLTKGIENEVITVKSSYPRRKMVYVTLRFTNSTKDEDVILAGIDYRVAGLTQKGIRQRADSNN